MKNILITIALAIFIFICGIAAINKPYHWADENLLIAHALGGINNKTYSNSLESFKYNYNKSTGYLKLI